MLAKFKLVLLWLALTGVAAAYLGMSLGTERQDVFLPGKTTSGHYQIELACNQCHTPFGGVKRDACNKCHGEELEAVEDSHPRKKFTDPRNADRTAKLDARECVTCHMEHRPEVTTEMGLSIQKDFCFRCHSDVGKDRPTHRGLKFDSCGSAGCHNFHDNKALYTDFLLAHQSEPDLNGPGMAPARKALVDWTPESPLTASAANYNQPANADITKQWAGSPHAANGVNCSHCHQAKDRSWTAKPGVASCQGCHKNQVAGFYAGKHGVRLDPKLEVTLSPMRPGMARQPMRPEAANKELGCASCHNPHSADVREAAVEACIGCHADQHTVAYKNSPHFRQWQKEVAGEGAPGSGVSCATCHMPREVRNSFGEERVVVQHNQNWNLRPNEKMIRDVCLQCHGLGFAIDALADSELIRRNFVGRPHAHVESIDMALKRPIGADQAQH